MSLFFNFLIQGQPMAILTPTTELEAVNVMMSHIGESPVNTLEDDNVIDATIAQTVLGSVNREVQSQGWYFNTEIGFPITKDSNNKFAVPANTARIDGVNTSTSSTHSSLDLVMRGGFMYDRRNHTYTPDAGTITVDLVVLLSFTDLPETVRRYITLRASRVFQERQLGSTVMSEFIAQDEARALAAVRNDEAWSGDHNMLTDSVTPRSITSRFGFDRGVY